MNDKSNIIRGTGRGDSRDGDAGRDDITRGIARHKCVYTALRVGLGWALQGLTGFSYEPCHIKSDTFLLLSNHTMDLDALFVIIGTKRHSRCVCSADVLDGFHGKIVSWLVGPIGRRKGASADSTVAQVRESLAHGISVNIQASGQRTWDGGPTYISPRTVELLKGSDCSLVTYRIEGGYFRTPRWARYKRRGPTHGRMVHEYSRDELDDMTDEEIYAAVCNDLAVDEYEVQRAHPHAYCGKHLAEGLEGACFLCPQCERFDGLSSHDDIISCKCGFAARYTEYGYLEPVRGSAVDSSSSRASAGSKADPDGLREHNTASIHSSRFFDTVLGWSRWQKSWLEEHREVLIASTETPFSTDRNVTFLKKTDGSWETLVEGAEARLYGDRLAVCAADQAEAETNDPGEGTRTRESDGSDVPDEPSTLTFPWARVSKLNGFRGSKVSFTFDGDLFAIRRHGGLSGIKYCMLGRILNGLEWE